MCLYLFPSLTLRVFDKYRVGVIEISQSNNPPHKMARLDRWAEFAVVNGKYLNIRCRGILADSVFSF